ncbi:RCC1 domain-containing protein [Catenibacillus scindens]|uniref:RCC1 domain-containing protein n=1 Tax=Catenibacillus scindens TaxID=673271 RepID=UPI00320B253B
MEIKNCPACGSAIPGGEDRCPVCGLDGQNQIFLSEEDYTAWVERVLKPHMKNVAPPQVFAGPNHALILMANGDLYGIGNNWNEACGPDLPRELKEPARIAQGVKHAAASPNHTLYVTRDGQTVLLGNSDLTDRFDCVLDTARRVYGKYDEDAFLIEDSDGQFYFFGENSGGRLVNDSSQVLRRLEDVVVHTKKTYTWWNEYENGTIRDAKYTEWGGKEEILHANFHTVKHLIPDEIPELEAVRREKWYRQLAREYGEKNVVIRLQPPNSAKTIESQILTKEHGVRNKEATLEYVYQASVVLENNVIYQPVPCELQGRLNGFFCDCWPVFGGTAQWLERKGIPEKAVKVMTGSFDDFKVYENILAYLDGEGNLGFMNGASGQPAVSPLSGITDFAVNSQEGNGDYILIVTDRREIYFGSKKELAEKGGWDHLKKLTL